MDMLLDKQLVRIFKEFILVEQLLLRVMVFLILEFQPQIILQGRLKRCLQPLGYLQLLMLILDLGNQKVVIEQSMNIFLLELQVFPKRCGHLEGKQLISTEDMINKIKACVKSSEEISQGEFIICARTDAYSVSGIKETIERSKRFIDSGASMIFPEGLKSLEEFSLVEKELRKHNKEILLLANMTEFGKTDYISLEEFQSIGYNCVIYPVSTLRVANQAIEDFLISLKEEGSQKSFLHKMQTRKQLYNTLQYNPSEQWVFPSSTKKNQQKTNFILMTF